MTDTLGFYTFLSLVKHKAFLWIILCVVITSLLSLLLAKNTINPARINAVITAEVVSVEAINDDVLRPSRKIIFRLETGEIKWAFGQGYRVGDRAQVVVYQRFLSRNLEYQLLVPIISSD